MTKIEFTGALAKQLAGLPGQEIDRITAFYAEAVDDRMEEGMGEEEAVAALGDPGEAARQAMMELPLPTLMKMKVKESRDRTDNKTLWIVLAILGFPVWFPLLITLGGVIFAVYATVWAVIVSIGAVVLSLAIAGVAAFIGFIPYMLTVTPAAGLFMLGVALALIGLTLILIKPVILICKGLARLTVYALRAVKRLFIPDKGI